MIKKHITCPLPFRGGPGRGSRGFRGFDHTFTFRKCYGKPLRKHQRTLINQLERQRRRTSLFVHIIDKPGNNSRDLLITYVRFLKQRYPWRIAAILGEDKPTADALAKSLPGHNLSASVRTPNHLRGCNYDIALVLNPKQDKVWDHISTLSPAIAENCPGCALIIWSEAPPPRRPRQRKPTGFTLTDYYYAQLTDPPDPPPRPTSRVLLILLNPNPQSQTTIPAQAPFPSGEGWGEATSI